MSMLNPQPKKAVSKPKFGMGALTKPKPTKTDQKVAPPTGQTPRGGAADVQSLANKSRVIDQKATDLEQAAALTHALLKARKKESKAFKNLVETGEECSAAFEGYAQHVHAADSDEHAEEWAGILDISTRMENQMQKLFQDLAKNLDQVDYEMETFQEQQLHPARTQKKNFMTAQRNLEGAMLKLAKTDPSNPKLKEYELEKEQKEKAYYQQGDLSYYTLTDTIQQQKFTNATQLCNNYEIYLMFFQKGLSYLESEKAKMIEYKKTILEEHGNFQKEVKAGNRPRNAWLPKGEGGGSSKKVFGVLYEELIEREQPEGMIVPFLDTCFKYLEENEDILRTQGLFRLSANKQQLDELRERLDKGADLDLNEIDDPHLITGLIKLFLRCLPEPLLTYQLYPEFIEVVETSKDTPELVGPILKAIVEKLPFPNRLLLQRLMKMCAAILKHTEFNLMTIQNLAIVLGPNMLYDRQVEDQAQEDNMMQTIQKVNLVIILLFSHSEKIFGKLLQSSQRNTVEGSGLSNSQSNATAKPIPPEPVKEAPRTVQIGTAPSIELPTTITEPMRLQRGSNPGFGSAMNAQVNQQGNQGGLTNSASALSNQQQAGGDEIEPLKFTEKGEIIPNYPLLSQKQMLTLVATVPSTKDFYFQCHELFVSCFAFTRAAINLKLYNAEEMNNLNSSFQFVAKAIRNMLSIIRDYSQKFPSDVSKRILLAANEVRPHIKQLIAYVKKFNSGGKHEPGFLPSTKLFVISVYHLYCVSSLASQMDELSASGVQCVALAAKFTKLIQEGQTKALDPLMISLVVNNLQNSTLQFTSVLRSRLSDVAESLQGQLTAVVEAAEQCINEIFDEAKNLLLSGTPTLTPNPSTTGTIESKIQQLTKLVHSTLALRSLISSSLLTANGQGGSGSAVEADMVAGTLEQFAAIFDAHFYEEEEFAQMKAIQIELANIRAKIESFPNCSSHSEVLDHAHAVISNLTSIEKCVETLVSSITDDSLVFALISYIDSVKHFSIDFQLGALAQIWDIRILGYDHLKCVGFLKDFAFVTFPFLYNFKDAILLSNGLL